MNRREARILLTEAWVKLMRLKYDGGSASEIEHAQRNVTAMQEVFKRRFGDEA